MSDAPGYFTDNAPILLMGVTGAQQEYLNDDEGEYGGKTAVASWWADDPGRTRDLVLFLNPKADAVADVLDDFQEVTSVDELAEAMGEGARRLVLTPRTEDWEAVSRRLAEFVGALPDDMTKLVVLDEAPELDDDAVKRFVRVHGNGAETQPLVLTQDPMAVDGSVVKMSLPVWVGPIKSSFKSWFDTHEYQDAYRHISEDHDPFEWSVLIGKGPGEWHYYEPVPARYAT